MKIGETYKIRPAGRHILTIGRDLIQDTYAAVVELVKNAYDADSPDVNIEFQVKPDKENYLIIITDHGHGMSREIVTTKWMVPSTDDKVGRRKSPGGRIMQGRKGVGRYAASILGSDLFLETVASDGEKTTAFLQWDLFEKAKYLDDVEILIETTSGVSEASGTRLTITGASSFSSEWSDDKIKRLKFELKKLISPVDTIVKTDESFCINFMIEGLGDNDSSERIEPVPIFDLFDYKIAGRIGADGKGFLTYSQQKVRNAAEESISFDNGKPTLCGEIIVDIRVYDREGESLDALIKRGLKDTSGKYFGRLSAKQLLNDYNGIGVYRNGFRIRPLGDPEFDWLQLNKARIQNPSMKIGSNQAIGYVLIQSEEQSNLIEKSARDGLRDNDAFAALKAITGKIIVKLEERRFAYRAKAGLSRPVVKVEHQLERLFSFENMKQRVRSRLTKGGVDQKTAGEVIDIISKDAEDKNRAADEIREAVAVYQGQATLGKIIYVVLHEGRHPLSFFSNQIPRIKKRTQSFREAGDPETAEEIGKIADGIGENAEIFVHLFHRLDPLATGRRSSARKLLLKEEISKVAEVFVGEMNTKGITFRINGPDGFSLESWSQDIYTIFTNLMDNSIYWISEKNTQMREIVVDLMTKDDSLLYIDYRDTGPGIEPSLITSGVIFEPQFSTKPHGTGLGLAIAGEAATRNGLDLKAFESDTGAYFRLQPVTEDLNDK